MADEQEKFDRFKPVAPKVPGVPDPNAAAPAAAGEAAAKKGIPKQWLLMGGGGVGLVLVIVVIAVLMQTEPPPVSPSAPPASADPSSPAATAAASPGASPGAPVAPGEIGTVQEFSQPWTAKRFIFRKFTDEYWAVVIRLPGGSQRSAGGYWAFALGERNGNCQLEFITDLPTLARDYGYRAQHPMVVDPCNKSVFDPLRNGDVGGAWVRGDVVKGSAYRPPLAILVRIENDRISAMQME